MVSIGRLLLVMDFFMAATAANVTKRKETRHQLTKKNEANNNKQIQEVREREEWEKMRDKFIYI